MVLNYPKALLCMKIIPLNVCFLYLLMYHRWRTVRTPKIAVPEDTASLKPCQKIDNKFDGRFVVILIVCNQ